MENLQIYDSQGRPLGEERGVVNQRIKDFFFGGVRAALTKSGSTYEFICFFRARESSASRSEQYYGVLETRDQSELGNFRNIIEDHIERRYDKKLDTSSEDTTVFETLGNVGLKSSPGKKPTRDDIVDLVSNGERAQVGVGSYEEATVLFQDMIADVQSPRLAIAENAQSSQLSEYDIVIEKGAYTGLELLGDTAKRIEEMKERQRRRRQQQLGVGPYGEESQSRSDRLLPVIGAAFGVVIAIVLVLYGACFLGVSIPIIGEPPGVSCGDGGVGGPHEVTNVSAQWEGSNLTLEGNLTHNGVAWNKMAKLSVELQDDNKTVLDRRSFPVNATNGSAFAETLALNDTLKQNTTRVVVEWENDTSVVTLEQTEEQSTPTPTEESYSMDSVSAEWEGAYLTLGGELAQNEKNWNESANLTVKLQNERDETLESKDYQVPVTDGVFSHEVEFDDAVKRNATYIIVEWQDNTSRDTLNQSEGQSTPTPTEASYSVDIVSAEWQETNLTLDGNLTHEGTAWTDSAELSVELRDDNNTTLHSRQFQVDATDGSAFTKTLEFSAALKENATQVVVEWENDTSREPLDEGPVMAVATSLSAPTAPSTETTAATRIEQSS